MTPDQMNMKIMQAYKEGWKQGRFNGLCSFVDIAWKNSQARKSLISSILPRQKTPNTPRK